MTERKTGTKNVNGQPHIEAIDPVCAMPGGEIRILGSGLGPRELRRPRVSFGEVNGAVVISSDQFIVARVPDGAASGQVVVASNGSRSNPGEVRIAAPVAEDLQSRYESRRRRPGQHLRNLLGLAGAEGSDRHLPHRRRRLRGQALRPRDDERRPDWPSTARAACTSPRASTARYTA